MPVGLLMLYATSFWIAWRGGRLHQAWHPRAAADRFRLRLLLGLSPVTAIRAPELVGRHRVEAFDPLAASLALLPAAEAAVNSGTWSRDVRFPRLPENPFPAGTEAAATVTWFTESYREAGKALLDAAGHGDPSARRPSPSESVNTQYCGRCEAQFLPSARICVACGGRPLLAFEADPAPRLAAGDPS